MLTRLIVFYDIIGAVVYKSLYKLRVICKTNLKYSNVCEKQSIKCVTCVLQCFKIGKYRHYHNYDCTVQKCINLLFVRLKI